MKYILFILTFLCLPVFADGQEIKDLQTEFDQKSKRLDSLNTELKALTKETETLTNEVKTLKEKITPYPRWDFGLFGTTGFNISTFSDWLSKEKPNTSATTIGLTVNSFMNLHQKKYFWKNGFNTTLGWLKFEDKDSDETAEFEVAADAFNATSLFGWKMMEKIALSLLGEYRTALLDTAFNNPGYLDLGGGGITWTPNAQFRAVLHSLNFNWVFSDSGSSYESSLGAKVVLDYNQKFAKNIFWKSNLSVFASYKDIKELSNWTWVNSVSTAVKGIGIGFDLGLRRNKQEAIARELEDNPVQIYWILGLTYSLSKKW